VKTLKYAFVCLLLAYSTSQAMTITTPTEANKQAYNNIVVKKLGIFETKNSRAKKLEDLAAALMNHALTRAQNMMTSYGIRVGIAPMKNYVMSLLSKADPKVFQAETYAAYPFLVMGARQSFLSLNREKREKLLQEELQELNYVYKEVIQALKNLGKTTKLPNEITLATMRVEKI